MTLQGVTSNPTADTAGCTRTIVRSAGAVCLILGAAVLLGWQFDIDRLKSVLPHLTQMKSNTALGTAFLGLALSLHGWQANSPKSRYRCPCFGGVRVADGAGDAARIRHRA